MFKTHIICYSVYIVLSLFGYTLAKKKKKKRKEGDAGGGGTGKMNID